jgi:hypothetical protein
VRVRTLVVVGVVVTCAAAPVAGCVDLFHSTDFETTAADASTTEASADAAPQDICVTPAADALAVATRACALLSACESPIGDNAIGRCLPNAIAAYDCTASSLRPTSGAPLAYWLCLKAASSCGDVQKCVYGDVARGCSDAGAFTNCVPERPARADCEPPFDGTKSENCSATGRICTANGGTAGYCSGSSGLGCSGPSSCDGTRLHACATGTILLEDGGKGTLDEGFDCAGYGAGECVHNATGASCKSTGDKPCATTDAVKCDGDFAVGCPNGIEERVSCAALTGGKAGTCTPTVGGRIWDVSRACGISATDGGSGCARDTCSKDKLSACVQGVSILIDCPTLGVTPALGTCRQFETFDGARPACGRP